MFKRYKLRKKNDNDKLVLKKGEIHIAEGHTLKTDLEKLRSLLKSQNKKTAFNRILNLDAETFEKYLYFITITSLSEYLNGDSDVVVHCLRRIVNSKNFLLVADTFFLYYKVMPKNKELCSLLINRYPLLMKKYMDYKGRNVISCSIDNIEFVTRMP